MARATLVLGLVGLLSSSAAGAQDRVDEARRLTELGRMAEARTLLRAELDTDPSPSTAFNLALIEHSVGDFEAAEALFVRLLANEFGELPNDRRQRAGELVAASIVEMGTIVLRWDAPLPATVRIDGRPQGRLVRGETLRVRLNPGVHVVNMQNAEMETVREVDVERASTTSISLGDVSGDSVDSAERSVDLSGDSISETPRRRWPWAVAIGVLVVGGVILGAVLATRDSSPQLPDRYVGLVEF